MLYAFGSNGAGQLNLGHEDDVNAPARCLLSSEGSTAAGAGRVVGGGNHTFVQIDDGHDNRVYLVGNEQPLNLPNAVILNSSRSTVPGVLELSSVRAFAATWDAFAVVVENEILTFGAGDKGQLGRMFDPQIASTIEADPSFVGSKAVEMPQGLSGRTVVDVVGGVQHFVAILDSGEVVGWGNGRKGQIGEPPGIVEKPRKIQGIDFKVHRVHCGREFTYLLGHPAEGRHLVLGSDKWSVKSHAPESVVGWKRAGASWGGVSVLLADGRVISWGRNDHGQAAPPGLPPLADMAVGSEHAIGLSRDGKILIWGWGEHGNCGSPVDDRGDVKDGWNVVRLPDSESPQRVLGLGAGCATSWIWATN